MAKQPKKIKTDKNSTPAPFSGTLPLQLPPWVKREWVGGLILLLAVMVIYLPVWQAGFNWDDDAHITENPSMIGLHGLKEIWTTSAARICPLVLTTFWVEHALWGLHPLPYHLVNVLLHGVSAILLWQVLRNLQIRGAWLGAALWALHPVQVETVAWITELKNTQSGLFYLLSILFFERDLRASASQHRNGVSWNYALSLLFASLAMASKSSTVILPLVLGLCAWWVEGRWHRRNLLKVAPMFLMAAAAALVSMWTQKLEGASDPQWTRSWPERLATSGDVVWFYLGKLLWPHPLIFIYPRWVIDAGSWLSYLPLAALLLVLIIVWLNCASWSRPWFFALAYFLAALLPVLGLIDHYFLRYSFVGDHFQYLASMGPLALAGAGLTRWADFVLPGQRQLQVTLCAALLLILGLLSWQQVWIYKSPETLWTDTLNKNPACWMAHNNLGNCLLLKKQEDQAIAHFQKALSINPNDSAAHDNLGHVFFQRGQMDEAMAQFQIAVQLNPNAPNARYNLGDALAQKGRIDAALEQYREVLKIDPHFTGAYNNLGIILVQKGQSDEAIIQFQKAVELNPDFADAHYNLGSALSQKQRVDEAIVQYQKTVELDPNLANAHYYLGNALTQKGRIDEAILQYQKTVDLDPNRVEAYNNLGNALTQKGRLDEAVIEFLQALEVNPNFAETHNNLGVTLFQKGQLNEAVAQFQEALRLKPDYADVQKNLAKVKAMMRQGAARK